MRVQANLRLLHQLALLYGVQTAYYDVSRRRRLASVESLLSVLRFLGAPLNIPEDVPSALRERRQELWRRRLEPVSVAWDGKPPLLKVRLPLSEADTIISARLNMETGESQHRAWPGTDLPLLETAEVEGNRYVVKQLPLSDVLPGGYHRLTLEAAGRREEALIISAPRRAYLPPEGEDNRLWGVFLPLYALHSQQSWGSGDFSDMAALASWLAGMGGQVIGTLPLLATFLNEMVEPSPYLPASRLLWNEFYLDITKVPELEKCPSARAILSSSSFQEEIKARRNSSLVDYRRGMALKRQVLAELCRCVFAEASDRLEALQHFAEANPVVDDYARFRAAGEKQHLPWRSWPQRLREGTLREGDYDEENRRYHLYVQWLAHQQIQALSEKSREKGLKLYLDLPLGVHPDGYDVWRERDAFIPGAAAGAPPDVVFTKGQNWEFPPLHPEKIREQGYRYHIAYLRHHLKQAGILRIDHVMGLHRLFCIPHGMEAKDGVYLRYRAEELYAILTLESYRHKAIIVGEDLGTVPAYVRSAMKQHGLHRMFVLYYELAAGTPKGLPPISHNSIASLNNHDMPTFAAFWEGLEIEDRRRVGLLDRAGARKERVAQRAIKKGLAAFLRNKGWLKETAADTRSVLLACLRFLSSSRARLVLVNLEDLWLETEPQNVPSIKEEFPNWRRKARHSFETFCQMPQVLDTLRIIDRLRKLGRHQG